MHNHKIRRMNLNNFTKNKDKKDVAGKYVTCKYESLQEKET